MGNMMEITLQQAETLVEKLHNASWDGWNLQIFTKDRSAQFNPRGVFRNGEWHKRKIIAVNERGTYLVSNDYARLLAKAGNRSQ